MKETKVLLAKEYISKDFLENFIHGKFPSTSRSYGRMGFHALLYNFSAVCGSSSLRLPNYGSSDLKSYIEKIDVLLASTVSLCPILVSFLD